MQALSNTSSLWHFAPEFVLSGFFLAIFLLDLPKVFAKQRYLAPAVAGAGLLAYIAVSLSLLSLPKALAFHGMIAVDPFTSFFRVFGAATTLFAVYFSLKAREVSGARAEYWALLLGIAIGMSMLAAAHNLLMIYLALEMVSILSYILVAYLPGSKRSAEAALKYVLYGATASGIMIYGFSLIFGLTGTLDVLQIRHFLEQNPAQRVTLMVSLIMVFAGFGFKISAVPFHMWAPDVYQGAPTPVTAFLSVGPKAAGFAVLLRFFYSALTVPQEGVFVPLKFLDLSTVLAVLALLTMTVGNLLAIQQKNIKRFLAYSSVAHAGYMLMGAAALNVEALRGILFYLLAYFVMNVGAFGIVIYVQNAFGSDELDAYRGLARRSGKGLGISLAMATFMFSLTGLPPTVGFAGKFYLFASLLQSKLYWLAVAGALNSVVSLYYYVRVVKHMFFDEAADAHPFEDQGRGFFALLAGLALATFVLGLFWSPLAELARASADLLG